MKIFYATDLHGHLWKYKKVLELVKETNDIDVVILGADILPKHIGSIFKKQKEFIHNTLKDFLIEIEKPIIIDIGNDDLEYVRKDFDKIILEIENAHSSHMKEVVINDVSFIGYHNVGDYPFGLKDHVRRDEHRIADQHQLGVPVISTDEGFEDIPDLKEYLLGLNSIDEDLELLPKPSKDKFVFIAHAPPRGVKLDVCMNFMEVGSWAITNYIIDKKPMVSVHGHIHENYWKTDIYWSDLNQSICIQPGQKGGFKSLVYCTFDLDDVENTIKRKEVSK